ncbi:hypothetical protein H2508_09840 [Parahaliea sp. F7430]|uniref:Uncharacterized protein n=1 Tax=Sediminihaliea albiluteola TaxID=2758564 RepID=A0A7W2TWU0_9GAMM|nr:hypothetical protein [Sediminihaliea albiluteola]MBA6413408.1 hypothetical protein [Sediminihaliea albiluteola]
MQKIESLVIQAILNSKTVKLFAVRSMEAGIRAVQEKSPVVASTEAGTKAVLEKYALVDGTHPKIVLSP